MSVIIVDEVQLSPLDTERLWGRNIEMPKPDSRIDGRMVELIGWVLGRTSPVVAVEILHGDGVIRRVPLMIQRPDIEVAFPQVAGAALSGFRTSVSLLGLIELELQVQAVLHNQQRVPLGSIRARRHWRQADYTIGATLVSVVIPCYNQAQLLSEAIESVIVQTYPHLEIVVVDDGSSDNTAEVARRYPGVRYVEQAHQGLAVARNTGLRRSNGSCLVFLDADDRLLPEAIAVGLAYMHKHPECAFVVGQGRLIGADGSEVSSPQRPPVEREHYLALLRECYIESTALVMYRRAVFEDVQGFEPSMSPVDDYDLYLRITQSFPICCHNTIITEYRKRASKTSWSIEAEGQAIIAVLHRQWPYVKRKNNRYKEAFKMGVRRWQAHNGKQLVRQVRAHGGSVSGNKRFTV